MFMLHAILLFHYFRINKLVYLFAPNCTANHPNVVNAFVYYFHSFWVLCVPFPLSYSLSLFFILFIHPSIHPTNNPSIYLSIYLSLSLCVYVRCVMLFDFRWFRHFLFSLFSRTVKLRQKGLKIVVKGKHEPFYSW